MDSQKNWYDFVSNKRERGITASSVRDNSPKSLLVLRTNMLKVHGMRQHYRGLLPFISSKKLMIWVLYSFVTNIFVLPWSHKNAVILGVLQGFVTIRRSKYSWKTDFSLIEDAEVFFLYKQIKKCYYIQKIFWIRL